MIVADVWFVSKCGRVNRQEHHVVTARDQLSRHRVIAQATAAIHPACSACEIKNSQLNSSDGNSMLECAARVKMIEEIAFVRLIPTHLVCRHRTYVESIDAWRSD